MTYLMFSISGKKEYNLSLLLLLLIYQLLQVSAITPEPRADQGCMFLPTNARIYCYGGQGYRTNDSSAPVAVVDQYFFSLSLTQNITVASMPSAWERINNDVGPNYYFASTAVPSKGLIFMDGGAGAGNNGTTLSRYKTATFSTDEGDGNWVEVIPARANDRMLFHSATLGKDNNTIYVYGGGRTVNTGATTEQNDFDDEMFIFDITVRSKHTLLNSLWKTGTAAGVISSYHEAVLVDSIIYYIGGIFSPPNEDHYLGGRMYSLLTYDTTNGQWNYKSTSMSPSPPSFRSRHTVTLKPKTKEIIVFGGQYPGNGSDILPDYFYVLNTESMVWHTPTLNNESASFTPLGICGHSAVLVEDNLFIMFGAVAEGETINIINKVWVMDVNRWAWVSSVSAVSQQETPSASVTPLPTNDGDTNNTGTIAGAVVGAVAGAVIITCAIFFYMRRRRQKSQNTMEEQIKDNKVIPKGDFPPRNYKDEMAPTIDNNRQSTSMGSHSRDTDLNSTEHPIYVNSSTSQAARLSGVHASNIEKPDGSFPSKENNEPGVQRLVLGPVKPDGA